MAQFHKGECYEFQTRNKIMAEAVGRKLRNDTATVQNMLCSHQSQPWPFFC